MVAGRVSGWRARPTARSLPHAPGGPRLDHRRRSGWCRRLSRLGGHGRRGIGRGGLPTTVVDPTKRSGRDFGRRPAGVCHRCRSDPTEECRRCGRLAPVQHVRFSCLVGVDGAEVDYQLAGSWEGPRHLAKSWAGRWVGHARPVSLATRIGPPRCHDLWTTFASARPIGGDDPLVPVSSSRVRVDSRKRSA